MSAIPVVDISSWAYPDKYIEAERKAVADTIGRACEEIGFFAIQNHGVDGALVERALKASKDFFDLPLDTKLAAKTDNEKDYPYGYENSERLNLSNTTGETNATPVDLKETFSCGPSNPKSGMPPRRFPSQPKDFEGALSEYYARMEELALTLLHIFAVALGLPNPGSWFGDKMDHHICALRILNYFPVKKADVMPGQLRASAHTDYGNLTILKSGGPGLQVKKDLEKAEWVDVPHLEDAFVINIGDLMQRWTNDKWISTLHRVIVPPTGDDVKRRQSIAFFTTVNGDCQVDPRDLQPGLVNPKYPPIAANDHLMNKHLAAMGVNSEAGDGAT